MQTEQTLLAPNGLQTDVKTKSRTETALSGASEVLGHVKEEGAALLHDARQEVAETYRSARDVAQRRAAELSERAQRAAETSSRYVVHASELTTTFVRTHALPLTLLGASLGWLIWSVRRQSRLHSEGPIVQRRRPLLADRAPTYERDGAEPRLSGATTSGAKLIGVRVGDAGYTG